MRKLILVIGLLIAIAVFLRGCQPSPPIQPRVVYTIYLPQITKSFNAKRGVVNLSTCEDVKTVGAAWTYGYSPAGTGCPIEDVPMIRDARQMQNWVSGNSQWIIGFNEPDGSEPYGSDLSPNQAVPLWHQVEEWFPNKLLVAPSPSSRWIFDESQWLTRFRNEYQAQHGAFPRFDALAVHIYFTNANQVVDVIHQAEVLAADWGIDEIWITEMGTPWTCTPNKTEMALTLGFLNADPMVTRYSWFGTALNLPQAWYSPSWCDISLADANGQITEYGIAYRDAR